MKSTVTPIKIVKGCVDILVTGLRASAGDWAGVAEKVGSGGVSLLGKMLGKQPTDQNKHFEYEAQQIAPALEFLINAEKVSDREAIFANLNEFAPQLFSATHVTPKELVNWQGEAALSLSLIHI